MTQMNFSRNHDDAELDNIIEQLNDYRTSTAAHNPLLIDEYPTEKAMTDMDKHELSRKLKQ